MPRTAIVILNYNGKKYLEKFLPGVIKYSQNCEIYVADNGSTDGSIDWLNNTIGIKIINLSRNYGFSGGYNKALEHIDTDYFILLNSDVEVTDQWTIPLINTLEKSTDIAACQPKILDYTHRNKFEYAGAAGGYIDSFGYPFCRGRIFKHIEEDNLQFDDNRRIFWATGACMGIKRNAFIEAGGFDERFFAHMEEIDLCWRLNRMGWQIRYTSGSHVFHVGGGTLSRSNPRKTFLNFKNGLSMIYKNLPSSQLWWKLPVRILLDISAAFLFLTSGLFLDFIAVFKAHGSFLLELNYTHKKRKEYSHYRINGFPIYKGLLPVEYFLKGKRKFEELNF